jgi:signal transduction histidine kinase
MTDLVWYRSLYWRIALGFVGVLAILLTAQALVFVWVSGRAADVWPGRTPAEYAHLIAADVAAVLVDQPAGNLEPYVNERFPGTYRAFVVVTRGREVIYGRGVPPPPMLGRAAMARLDGQTGPAAGDPQRGGRGGRGRGVRFGGPGGPGGPGGAFVFAPILVEGTTVGMVAVAETPPPMWAAISNLGPALAVQALVVLCVGALLVALLVFRPARRRLSSLQSAVQSFGTGRTDVRAPTEGGDEVAGLARAFNEMAARLEERAEALRESDRVRRQLLADVSHELGTPLAAIRGYVETLSMPTIPLDNATRVRYLGIVTQETERLERVVGDLLDLARLEGGGVPMQRRPVSVDSLFRRVVDRHEPMLRDQALTMVTSVTPEGLEVPGDVDRLEQALQNLAANAIRHTPAAGTVRLSATVDGQEVVLTVEDTGPGVPQEHLGRVFDRFYKADASRTGTATPSGSGLGLSIVRAIVHAHGGHVSVTNVEGSGALFTLRLPGAADGVNCGKAVAAS